MNILYFNLLSLNQTWFKPSTACWRWTQPLTSQETCFYETRECESNRLHLHCDRPGIRPVLSQRRWLSLRLCVDGCVLALFERDGVGSDICCCPTWRCVAYITLQRGGWWMTSSSNTHSHVLNIHSHLCVVFKETLQGRLSRPWTGSVCHTDAASTRGGSKNQPFIVESGLSLEKVLAAEPCQVGRVVLVGSWTRHSDLCKRKDNVVVQLACSC